MTSPHATGDRLESWKEIAGYLRRDVTTVQRWEKREGMPVHRHVHDKGGSVYAFRDELDAWVRARHPASPSAEPRDHAGDDGPVVEAGARAEASRWLWPALAAAVLAVAAALWFLRHAPAPSRNPLAEARFVQVTDFAGIEQAAAISRDGSFVAFLSDRDGRMDVWVTQVGTGQFHNLTRGATQELVNPSVRTVGFSPDGSLVTFWIRDTSGAINIWAAPTLGGPPRPYLEGAAELDWSRQGRLVYHTPGPGDPMFVRDAGEPPPGRQIFAAPSGLHAHFPSWSPDDAFIYFVQGSVPDAMDVWRIRPSGDQRERVTHHAARVSHPVLLDRRTLLYLATDAEGAGPWLMTTDVDRRLPQRVSAGLDRFTSLAASASGDRVVATLASPKVTLWRMPLASAPAGLSDASRISLTTASGSSPRLGQDYLIYVSPKGASESVWKLQGDAATELWSAAGADVVGGPALSADGRRIAFSARAGGRTSLYVMNADGTGARAVASALDVQGAPAWAPDGQSLVTAALDNGAPRLFLVPLDGGTAAPLVGEPSVDPVWSDDGRFVLFSGADVGTTFQVKAVTRTGEPHALPKLTLTRGARRLRMLPGQHAIVMLDGEIRHNNLWAFDLETGQSRRLTNLPANFEIRDFDVSPDGKEIVVERVEDHSDIVLLELPRR